MSNFWEDLVDDEVGILDEAPAPAPQPREVVGDGYVDGSGSVRVWTDDRGDIVHILVANNWRERSKRPLVQRFRMACHSANMQALLPGSEAELAGVPTGPADLDALDHRALWEEDFFDPGELNELMNRTVDLLQRSEDEGLPPPTVTFDPAEGVSTNQKVWVKLGMNREVVALRIDSAWADGARAERIADSVLEALSRAYEVWVAPVVEDGPAQQLVRETRALRRDTESLFERYSSRRNVDE